MRLRAAKLLMASTKRWVMGAIRAEDGTAAPRILRKKYAAPAALWSRGT